MPDRSELLKEIDTVPLEFVKEVIDFIGYLKDKQSSDSGSPETEPALPVSANSAPRSPSDSQIPVLPLDMDEIPLDFLREVIDFLGYLKKKNEHTGRTDISLN